MKQNGKAKNKPWERQETDTDKSFAAFQVYLNMPDRTTEKTAKQLRKNWGFIQQWCARHDWVARARDYDNWIIKQTQKRLEEKACKLQDKHLKYLESHIDALMVVDSELAKRHKNGELSDIDIEKLVDSSSKNTEALIKAMNQIRVVGGMYSDKKQIDVDVPKTVEEFRKLLG
jgi:hypothetical protein